MKREQRKAIEYLARTGLAGRGLVYLLIAFVAMQIPFGEPSSADKEGVMASISSKPWGTPVLIAIAIGFAGYAIWRLVEAILDPEGKSKKTEGKFKRAGYLFRGILYTTFAYSALRVAFTKQSQGSTQKAQETTAGVFSLPGGKWIVLAFGLGVIAAGAYNGYRAFAGKYRKDFKVHEMSASQRKFLFPVAAAGLYSRAVVFCLVGIFFVRSALTIDPAKARGLDGALHEILNSPGGYWWLEIVAAGLAAFGIFSLAQARYRSIMNS
ncbi:MAG: DUF1206 domain-containing protein [Actinomycetota bacterium]